ncbi:MAG: hypothetical protein HYU54_05095 [Actinobacteria bacterium]|nr:hypothetical protein [Actinomycetota bacterium]
MGAERAEKAPGFDPPAPGVLPDAPLAGGPPRERGPAVHPRALRLVLVRWHDAWFDFEQPTAGWREDYLVQTVGFVVRETPEVISVAQEHLPGRDGFRAVTHIPRGVVESVTTLFEEEGLARRAGDRALRREA